MHQIIRNVELRYWKSDSEEWWSMGKEPMVSFPWADDIINTIAVNIGIMSVVHVAPVGEGLPSFAVEVSVSEWWSDVMILLVVTDHIFGLFMSGIIPEVGVSSDSTLAPVGTVIDGWAPWVASGESRPMSALSIVTGDIFLAITVDVSPCDPWALMAAPFVEIWLIFVVESTVSSGVGDPMFSVGFTTGHVSFAITIDVNELSVSSGISAPSPWDFFEIYFWPGTIRWNQGPALSIRFATDHLDCTVTC